MPALVTAAAAVPAAAITRPTAPAPTTPPTPPTGTSTSAPDGDGVDVATLRPSHLANGLYDLRLTVTDTSTGKQDADVREVRVDTQMKLGDFTLPVTDLAVPVPGGMPVTVSRVYDSAMAAQDRGDFGPGWRLELPDVDLYSEARRHDASQYNLATPSTPSLFYGDLVYVTLPGGKQDVFAFEPTALDPNAPTSLYTPGFQDVSGSGDTLTVPQQASDGGNVYLTQSPAGEFYYDSTSGQFGYNPAVKLSGGAYLFGGTYSLTTPQGVRYDIDAASGRVTQLTGPQGDWQKFNYADATDTQVSSINTSAGATVSFTRDTTTHYITLVTDPSNHSVHYNYTNGALSSVTARDGGVTGYAYADAAHANYLLTGVTDPRGIQVLTVGYSAAGEMASLTDIQKHSAPIAPTTTDALGGHQVVTDLAGNTSELVFDLHGNLAREIKTLKDSAGNVSGYFVSVHDYQYDTGAGLNILDTAREGVPFTVQGADSDGLRYSKEPVWASITTYNSDGTVKQRDNLLPQEMRSDGTYAYATTTYDAGLYFLGQPRVVTDSFGATTVTAFDERPQVQDPRYPLDPTKTVPNPGYGLPLSVTNAVGETTYYTRTVAVDAANQPHLASVETYQNRPGPGSGTHHFTLSLDTYYAPGTMVLVAGVQVPQDGRLASHYDAKSGLTTLYTYDANGNVLTSKHQWVNPDNTNDTRWLQTKNTFDAAGRVTGTLTGTYTTQDCTTVYSGTVELSTSNVYDLAGNLSYSLDDLGGRTDYHYDLRGQLVETLFPDGTRVRTVYDAMGRVSWQSDRYDPKNPTPPHGTQTVYDQEGRVAATNRYSGVSIGVTADPTYAGVYDVTFTPPPLSAKLSTAGTTFDDAGRVDSTVGTDGQTTKNSYFPDGSLKTVTTAYGTPQAATTAYSYHNAPTADGDQGRYTIVTDARGYATRTDTDALGRTVQTISDYVPGTPPGTNGNPNASITSVSYSPYGLHVAKGSDKVPGTDLILPRPLHVNRFLAPYLIPPRPPTTRD